MLFCDIVLFGRTGTALWQDVFRRRVEVGGNAGLPGDHDQIINGSRRTHSWYLPKPNSSLNTGLPNAVFTLPSKTMITPDSKKPKRFL
jgi:hypothetical protein